MYFAFILDVYNAELTKFARLITYGKRCWSLSLFRESLFPCRANLSLGNDCIELTVVKNENITTTKEQDLNKLNDIV